MNTITVIGVILVVIGAVGLIWGGIDYTSNRNAINMGGMHLEVNETRHIPLSPIAGAVALAAGVILIVVGRKRPTGGRT